MAAADPGMAPASAPPGRSNLASRVIVGVFLAVVAIVDIWIGGWAFEIMIALGVAIVFWEWSGLQKIHRVFRLVGVALLLFALLMARGGQPDLALLALGVGAFGLIVNMWAAGAFPRGRRWASTGLLYAGLPGVALIWLRQQPDGFALVMWTMGVVWATDIFAYFAGRAIGGPKIWTAISPNKTWAGLGGGMIAAALFSILFARLSGWHQTMLAMALIGALLAVIAQAGDFFESWLKRRAGVKDSGTLLGGHGGVMDRVDGLVPVCVVVALWVSARTPATLVLASTEALP